MKEKSIKLICKGNSHVDGKTVKAGAIVSFKESLAKELISSGRFAKATEDDEKAAKKATAAKAK